MKPLGIVGALIGGLVGALIWGGIAAAIHLEIGYMATGVGFFVGMSSAFLGGTGKANGVMCALVALLSMFGGKIAAQKFTLSSSIREDLLKNPEYAKLPKEEIEMMVSYVVQRVTLSDLVESVKENLDIVDLVFAVVSIGAAFQIGSGKNRIQASPAPTHAAQPPNSGAPPMPPQTPEGLEPLAPPPPSGFPDGG